MWRRFFRAHSVCHSMTTTWRGVSFSVTYYIFHFPAAIPPEAVTQLCRRPLSCSCVYTVLLFVIAHWASPHTYYIFLHMFWRLNRGAEPSPKKLKVSMSEINTLVDRLCRMNEEYHIHNSPVYEHSAPMPCCLCLWEVLVNPCSHLRWIWRWPGCQFGVDDDDEEKLPPIQKAGGLTGFSSGNNSFYCVKKQ